MNKNQYLILRLNILDIVAILSILFFEFNIQKIEFDIFRILVLVYTIYYLCKNLFIIKCKVFDTFYFSIHIAINLFYLVIWFIIMLIFVINNTW